MRWQSEAVGSTFSLRLPSPIMKTVIVIGRSFPLFRLKLRANETSAVPLRASTSEIRSSHSPLATEAESHGSDAGEIATIESRRFSYPMLMYSDPYGVANDKLTYIFIGGAWQLFHLN